MLKQGYLLGGHIQRILETAAFGLPLIELIDSDDPTTQALIMAPTRELGQQTAKQLVDFSSGTKNLNVEVVYGGAAITNQIKALRRRGIDTDA